MATPVSSTVVKTFAILQLFGDRPSVTTSMVTAELGYPHSTAYRLLTGLVSVGVLRQPAKDHYVLSLSLFELGSLAPTRRQLCDRARLPLERLTSETGLPTHMGALDGDNVVLLETITGRLFSLPTRVGHKAPIHATSLGKLMLAHADEVTRSRVVAGPLHRFTRHTITSRSGLEAELMRIVSDDYAQEVEETHLGAACIAVPVRLHGECVAGISISGPVTRFAAMRDTYIGMLNRAARQIERGVAWQSTLTWPAGQDRAAG